MQVLIDSRAVSSIFASELFNHLNVPQSYITTTQILSVTIANGQMMKVLVETELPLNVHNLQMLHSFLALRCLCPDRIHQAGFYERVHCNNQYCRRLHNVL